MHSQPLPSSPPLSFVRSLPHTPGPVPLLETFSSPCLCSPHLALTFRGFLCQGVLKSVFTILRFDIWHRGQMFKKERVCGPPQKNVGRIVHCHSRRTPSYRYFFQRLHHFLKYIQKYTHGHSTKLPSEIACAEQFFFFFCEGYIRSTESFPRIHELSLFFVPFPFGWTLRVLLMLCWLWCSWRHTQPPPAPPLNTRIQFCFAS